MQLQTLKKKKLPDTPGVYMFIGARRKILYIGKATSLRSRVRSYFDKDIAHKRGQHIAAMVEQAKMVDHIETDSVLEALILEASLIKKYKSHYNTKEKDDKSFNYIVITKEDFPRVIIVRGRELLGSSTAKLKYDVKYTFGPFPKGTVLKDALKIIRKIFPFRDKCLPARSAQVGTSVPRKPCFNRQIKLCPGVCSGEISKKEYAKVIQNICLFLDGKKGQVIKKLERQMSVAAKRLEFEKADEIKKTIFALKHIRDVALIKESPRPNIRRRTSDVSSGGFRIEAYDVAHISGKFVVGVMTVVENGEVKKSDYRKFKIKSFEGADDTRALKEVLDRRLSHPEWQLPKLIIVDGGKAQKNTAEKVLKKAGVVIPVVGVVKDERHKPKNIIGKSSLVEKYEKEILLANSEAHRFAITYHRFLRNKLN
jgi:excinuclease ABC subunit C